METDNSKKQGHAWSKQNELKKKYGQIGIPTIVEIKNMADGLTDQRTKALFITLYLTAGRISEIVNSLKRDHLGIELRKGRKTLIIRLANRKHKERHFKELIIPLDMPYEHSFAEILLTYADTKPNDFVFGFSTTRAYQILIKETGFNPHWMRHIRLTHLVKNYGFEDHKLIRWAGWTDNRAAKQYIELSTDDFLDNFKTEPS